GRFGFMQARTRASIYSLLQGSYLSQGWLIPTLPSPLAPPSSQGVLHPQALRLNDGSGLGGNVSGFNASRISLSRLRSPPLTTSSLASRRSSASSTSASFRSWFRW